MDEREDYTEEMEAKPVRKGPGGLAWLVALLVMLFAVVMFIPAVLNGSLASYALAGLARELRGDYLGAIEIYSALEQEAEDIERWAEDNFSFGSSAAPGFTANAFGLQRFIAIRGRQLGPLMFWQLEMHRQQERQIPWLSLYAQLRPRMPRALRDFARQVDTIGLIHLGVQEQELPADGPGSLEDDLQALAAARAADVFAEERALFYDAIALLWLASEDPTTDEVGERLAALQNAAGREAWMYHGIALNRAREMEDFALLASLSERHGRDPAVMETHVRALFLAGETRRAHDAAQRLARRPRMRGPMQLLRAELLYREGRYAEAIALAEEIAAAERDDNRAVYLDAVGIQGIALMLQGQTEQAFALLQPYVFLPDNERIFLTAMTAAIAAGEIAFLDSVIPPDFREADLRPAQIALLAGETTLHAIFTEGWGGLGA